MCRVGKDILLVFTSGKGDETVLKSIKDVSSAERRENRCEHIVNFLEKEGFQVEVREEMLRFDFTTSEKVVDILSAMEFDNHVSSEERGKIKKFMEGKEEFTQGAYFVHAVRTQ